MVHWMNIPARVSLLSGLFIFDVVFVVNSAVHGYLVVSYVAQEASSTDVGFYYMTNAVDKLFGHFFQVLCI